jgi:hypothetical protein
VIVVNIGHCDVQITVVCGCDVPVTVMYRVL